MANNPQKIKLKLKAFDHRILDKSVQDIVSIIKRTGSKMSGPIPMPRKITRFSVNRSTHVNKESAEQFEIREHARVLVIEEVTPRTLEVLSQLSVALGVDVQIKVMGNA